MPDPTHARSPWQFSIREFFLAVVAISSLIVLYTSQRSFEPTGFGNSFEPNQIVKDALKKLGVSPNGGTGGGGSKGTRRLSMSYRSSFQKGIGTTQSAVLSEIKSIVEKQIVDSGCQILGTGMTGKAADDSLVEFEIEYKSPNAFGQIRVRTTTGEKGDWQFWSDVFEY